MLFNIFGLHRVLLEPKYSQHWSGQQRSKLWRSGHRRRRVRGWCCGDGHDCGGLRGRDSRYLNRRGPRRCSMAASVVESVVGAADMTAGTSFVEVPVLEADGVVDDVEPITYTLTALVWRRTRHVATASRLCRFSAARVEILA